jgi:hypothetical protein
MPFTYSYYAIWLVMKNSCDTYILLPFELHLLYFTY